MKAKTILHDGNEYAVLKDGNPVYVDGSGKEVTYDPVSMHQTISRLNKESQTHREAKEALETQVKVFEGLDPAVARKALETIKNFDDKKLIDAGEVERVKKETSDAFQKKLDEAAKENEVLRNQYASEKITAAFASSKFILDKLAVPADMAQATFGKNFVFKEGALVPFDSAGNPIYSDKNPGNIASFEEAIEKVVNTYQFRDSILKGSGHTGSGSTGPQGQSGKRTITRKQFEALDPSEQHKFATSKEVSIVD